MSIFTLMLIGIVAVSVFAYSDRPFMQQKYGVMSPEERETRMLEHEKLLDEGYDAWYEEVSQLDPQPRMLDYVTEDNFDLFVEMHDAKEAGDFERVRQIRQELGFEGRGMHDDKGMHGQGLRDGSGKGLRDESGRGMGRHSGRGDCQYR